MKRSAKLVVLCAGVGTILSLAIPQAAHAGVVEKRTFEGRGSSEVYERGMRAALDAAQEQMGEFEAAQEQNCTLTGMSVKLDTVLKKIPPVYVWKAEVVANCS